MKLLKKILVITFIIALVCIIKTTCFATTAIVNTDTLKLRKEASTDCEVLELLSQNQELEVIEQSGDWYKIKYKQMVGYVHKDYIKVKLDDIYPPVKLPIIGEKSVFDIIYALTGDEGTVTLIDEEIDFLEDEILTELEEYVYFEGYLGYFSYNKEILEERKEGKF